MAAKKTVARRRAIPIKSQYQKSKIQESSREERAAPEITAETVVVEETVKSFQEDVAGSQKKIKPFSISKHFVIYTTVSLMLLISLATAGYFFYEYQQTQRLLQDPKVAGTKELTKTVDQIGKLIELPVNEQPTVATVSDINKLKGQAFFEKAQNGDKVLIYATAKKAYLYRPSMNRLIDVAPVSFPSPQPTVAGAATLSGIAGTVTPSPSGTTSEEIKVALFNGSGVTGVTKSVEERLSTSIENVQVTTRENAQKLNYQQTVVVDLSGEKQGVAGNLISVLGVGKLSPLPEGETKPTNADFLVILGTDYKE
jgi:hypothetical protein